MNPQQMHQVRTIAQEQFQPFLEQHKLLIDELAEKCNLNDNVKDDTKINERISKIIEQENQIKTELKKENDQLKEIIEGQKNNFDIQQKELIEQVTNYLTEYKNNIQLIIDKMNERIDKLENGEISISVPAKDMANAIENYYNTVIKSISVAIATLNAALLDLRGKKKSYENLLEELSNTEKCIQEDMNPIILQSIKKTISSIEVQIDQFNIDQINENIQAAEKEFVVLKNKLEQLKRHHL